MVQTGQDLLSGCLLSVVLFSAGTDWAWRRIPNGLVLPVIPLALLLRLVAGGLCELWAGVLGAALGLSLGWLHVRAGLMGGGDAKLLSCVGALGGWWLLTHACLWAVCAGGAVAVGLGVMASLRPGAARRCPHLPFGPLMAFGVLVTFSLWGMR